MKLWRLQGRGLANLTLRDETLPQPGPGEVRMKVVAASLNARDVGVAEGSYFAAPDVVPLSDGAGIVDAIGPGVTGFAPGDAVVNCFYENWESGPATPENHARSFGSERDGLLTEYLVLPATALIAKPSTLSFAEASTMGCAAITAWTALFTEGRLKPGQHVVVQGTGGVALFALQFAKMAGASVTLLSSSDAKLERGRAMGADHLVNYRHIPDWGAEVLRFTGGRGADIVVELGGPATLPQSQIALRMDGLIAIIGLLTGIEAPLSIPLTIVRHARIQGITVGHRQDMIAMGRAMDLHGIRPVIDRVFAFSDAAAAFAALPEGTHFGKLVITVSEDQP